VSGRLLTCEPAPCLSSRYPCLKRYVGIGQYDYPVMAAIEYPPLRFIPGLVMLAQFRSDAINDCLRRAEEARRTAEATSNPHTRAEYLEFEGRWLSLARGFATEAERATEQLAA
jgi:hypothetical protein